MKTAVFSVLALAAAANATKYSTYYETETVTITSCEPYQTKCAYHETSKIHTLTKECDDDDNKSYPTPTPAVHYPVKPDTSSKAAYPTSAVYPPGSAVYPTTKPAEYTVSTIYETKKYTITSCAPTVYDCPIGHVTSTVVATTTLCPVVPTKPAEHYPVGSSIHVYPSKPAVPEVHYPAVPSKPAVPEVNKPVVPSKPAEPVCPGGAYCPTTVKTVYPTGGPITPPKNSTVPFTGSASAQRAGGLLLAVGVAAAALL